MRRSLAMATVMAVATLLVSFVGLSSPAGACSCAGGIDEATRDAEAEIIFVGRAIDVTEDEASPDPFDDVAYEVDVEVVHKGEVPDPATLWTARDGATCGISLELGELYKLYPRRAGDGRLHVGLCDGNRPATAADLETVGPPATPTTATSTPPETPPPPTDTTAPALDTSTTTIAAPSSTPSTPTTGPGDEAADAVTVADDGDDLGLLVPAAGAGAALSVLAGLYVVRRRP